MTTSGSTNFSVSRNQVIIAALQAIRVLGEDETPSSSAIGSANILLNMLTKSFENYSKNVWKKSECTLFPQMGQASYTLGGSSTDHATESFVQTTLSAAEASGQTVLSVTSSSGMTAADYVGIVMDDGSTHWTTIVSVDSAIQITITTATDDDAASGNVVFAYTTKIFKPLKIYGIRRLEVSNDNETNIKEISYNDYQKMPNKTTTATPMSYHYQRNNADGILYVWQAPMDASDVLKITYASSFEDFDNTSDTPDFPQEWFRALYLGLACDLAHPYGKATGDAYIALKADYTNELRLALAFDVESTYVKMKPGR